MLSCSIARSRALRRAVQTGHLAEMDFIHTIQASEGCDSCFGRMETVCGRFNCRWHEECAELSLVSPAPREAVFA